MENSRTDTWCHQFALQQFKPFPLPLAICQFAVTGAFLPLAFLPLLFVVHGPYFCIEEYTMKEINYQYFIVTCITIRLHLICDRDVGKKKGEGTETVDH